VLADLLVTDLRTGSSEIRKRIPELLRGLAEDGRLLQIEDEYLLQTEESTAWEMDYRQRLARVLADDGRIAQERTDLFKREIAERLREVKLLQGKSKQPRRLEIFYGGEQNLYAHSKELVGDRDARAHEFSLQLRAFDAARSGVGLGLPTLLAMCSGLLEKSLKGGFIVVGGLNLGGSIDPVHNALGVAELAVEKGASILLMPVSARKQLFELSDDMATKINILFYADLREALLKALVD
jgi:ATP-dependent Lon protease